MFRATWEPDAAWVAACQQVAPPTDASSHVTIRWVPGTPEAPIQRWCLFECVPVAALMQAHHPILGTLDPETTDPMYRWALDYARTTGTLPVGLWAVQGPDGGHPIQWTAAEQVLANAGLLQPTTLPALGDLPYAAPDARVWQALTQRRALRALVADPYTARVIARKAAEQRARAAEMTATEDALRDVVRDAAPALMEHARPIDATERHQPGGLVTADDMARYIETGDLTIARSEPLWRGWTGR